MHKSILSAWFHLQIGSTRLGTRRSFIHDCEDHKDGGENEKEDEAPDEDEWPILCRKQNTKHMRFLQFLHHMKAFWV